MSANQLSAYLVQPDLSGKQSRHWTGFSTRLLRVHRSRPRVAPRALMALFIWGLFIFGLQLTHAPQNASASQQKLSILDSASQYTTPPSSAPVVALSKAAPAAPVSSAVAAVPAEIAVDPYGAFANNYDPGQCTWYVASRRKIPSNWGNANMWYYHAELAGWSVGATPRVGAIAWTDAGYYGHVALVASVSADGSQVQVSEMNYYGPYSRDTRWTPTSSFRYIY